MITYNIKMELQSERTIPTDIVLTSGDVKAYQLIFTFYSEGKRRDVTGHVLNIKAKRADGVVVIDTGEITPEGKAVYDIQSNIYDVPGKLTMEVALATEDGCYATTKELTMTVRQGYGNGDLKAENTTPILAKLSEQSLKAERVISEADRVVNMNVFAQSLDSGSVATVEKIDDEEGIVLKFGIPEGKQGEKGEPGADGYTPKKGVDYFTEVDKEEMLDDYVKNTDYATNNKAGLLRVAYGYGTQITSDGFLTIARCSKSELDSKINSTHPVTPDMIDYAVEVCTNQDSEAELTEAQLKLPPSTQFLKSGYMPLSGGALTGAISFKDANAIASKSDEQPRFILVMESFANGGAVKYVTRDFLLGDVETALDSILAIQEALIGGDSV